MKECITHHKACDCREEKIKKLIEALKFYANKKHWGEPGADTRDWYLIESSDRGDTAKIALKEWEE